MLWSHSILVAVANHILYDTIHTLNSTCDLPSEECISSSEVVSIKRIYRMTNCTAIMHTRRLSIIVKMSIDNPPSPQQHSGFG